MKLSECVGSNKPIHPRKDGAVMLDLCSDVMVRSLVKHGIVERKSKILKAPVVKDRLVRHWIRGYLDGDGCVRMNNKSLYVEIVGTLDVTNFIRSQWAEFTAPKEKDGCWHLRMHGNLKVDKFLSWIYNRSGICLQRKRSVWQNREVYH